jgi:hypothetical protein
MFFSTESQLFINILNYDYEVRPQRRIILSVPIDFSLRLRRITGTPIIPCQSVCPQNKTAQTTATIWTKLGVKDLHYIVMRQSDFKFLWLVLRENLLEILNIFKCRVPPL